MNQLHRLDAGAKRALMGGAAWAMMLALAAAQETAAPLFTAPATPPPPLAATAATDVLQRRFVAVDKALLRGLEAGTTTRVKLDLFGAERTAVFTAREQAAPGRFVLLGTIEGVSPSRVALSVYNGAVMLNAVAHGGRPVRLQSAGADSYWLEEVDPAAPCPCGTDDHAPAPPEANAAPPPPAPDGNGWADVIAFYTPQARDAAGGDSAIRSAIASRVATANGTHTGSATGLRLRLLDIIYTGYNESGFIDTDLTRLDNASDGFIDDLVVTADDRGADLVHLFVNEQGTTTNSSVIGRANMSGRFGVTKWNAGDLTFTHEVGHNLGCRHQVANDSGGTIEHAWEATYDWYVLGIYIYTARAQTVMWASVTSTMTDRFSDPNNSITFYDNFTNSGPIPLGTTGSANNKSYIFSFRQGTVGRSEPRFYLFPGSSGEATVNSPAGTLADVFGTWYPNTWASGTSAVPIRLWQGNYPTAGRITQKCRIENWGNFGVARIGP